MFYDNDLDNIIIQNLSHEHTERLIRPINQIIKRFRPEHAQANARSIRLDVRKYHRKSRLNG